LKKPDGQQHIQVVQVAAILHQQLQQLPALLVLFQLPERG
jgi:hypothetical protein